MGVYGMSVISVPFILFLPTVVGINFTLPKKLRTSWLFAAGLLFYLSNDIRYLPGLAFCIVTTYGAGLFLGQSREGSGRKKILALCILANVSALLLWRILLPTSPFVPLGISFFSLQAMGYVIDVYRDRTAAERNFVTYAVYVSFFPTIISGPIQRSRDLLPQLREGRDFDYQKAHSGLYLLLWGYFLKIVMADQIGHMVDYAYGSSQELPGATLLWATVLYSIQLYCDFAGYSALATGTAKMLGFDLRDNFLQPYFVSSVRDFWNRWHISLSSWLRDYVYIPLGGSRKGRLRTQCNLLITFLVSGLWHGAGGNFMVWGALHGFYRILGNIITGAFSKSTSTDTCAPQEQHRSLISLAGHGMRILSTFALVDFAWLFFRADSVSHALHILYRIFFRFHFHEMTYYGSYLLGCTKPGLLILFLGLLLVFAVDFLHEKKISMEHIMAHKVLLGARWTIYVAFTLLILLVIVRNYGQMASTFIYERF